jgi:membrane protein implicated in regulation of membrane protease activity
MKIGQILKNAVLITIIRPFRVIMTVLGSAAVLFFGFKYPALIFFFGGSLIAYWAFYNFYATFTKMQDQAEKLKQKEQEEQEASEGEESDDPSDSEPDDDDSRVKEEGKKE